MFYSHEGCDTVKKRKSIVYTFIKLSRCTGKGGNIKKEGKSALYVDISQSSLNRYSRVDNNFEATYSVPKRRYILRHRNELI